MDTITLYTNPMSRGFNVLWMLEECEATYDYKIISYGNAMKSADYLIINPMGKVPALTHGNTVITETAAIITYLADQFPNKQLAPAINSPLRGEYYRWIFFCTNTFEYAMINHFLGFQANSDEARKMLGYGNLNNVLNTLNNELNKNQYLVNNQFSTADLLMSSLIMFGINKLKLLPEDSIFMDYMTRVQQRPAYRKALAITQTWIES